MAVKPRTEPRPIWSAEKPAATAQEFGRQAVREYKTAWRRLRRTTPKPAAP